MSQAMYKKISSDSYAIKPFMAVGGCPITYQSICSPQKSNPLEWVNSVLSSIPSDQCGDSLDGEDCVLDILNSNGDIIDEYIVSRVGMLSLIEKYGLKAEEPVMFYADAPHGAKSQYRIHFCVQRGVAICGADNIPSIGGTTYELLDGMATDIDGNTIEFEDVVTCKTCIKMARAKYATSFNDR